MSDTHRTTDRRRSSPRRREQIHRMAAFHARCAEFDYAAAADYAEDFAARHPSSRLARDVATLCRRRAETLASPTGS